MNQGPWTCFHCGETFTEIESARIHFGSEPESVSGCMIKAGEEHGLLKALREAEEQLARYRVEDSDSDQRYYAQQADHQRALVKAEQEGYDKGLRDGSEPI